MLNPKLKKITIYYHMPVIINGDGYLFNPVMGIFIESIQKYFKNITIICFYRKNDNSINYEIKDLKNIDIVVLGSEGIFWDYLKKIKRTKEILSSQNTDLLFFRMPTSLFYLVWENLKKPKFVIFLFVGNPPNISDSQRKINNYFLNLFITIRARWKNYLIKKIITHSNSLLLANSYDLKTKWGKILRSNIRIMHTSSISVHDIISNSKRKNIKKSIKNKIELLFLGRVEIDKGIFDAIESVLILNEKFKFNCRLKIVGPLEHITKIELLNYIEKKSLTKYVKYIGPVTFGKTLLNFYKNADYFLMPSYHEGMPKVIWESLSQGTPVISTRVGGIDSFLNHKEEIYFVQKRNPHSIANAIIDIEKNEKLKSRLIKNGLALVMNFTKERQGELLYNHIKMFYKTL